MNFKKSLLALTAVFGLAACSSNDKDSQINEATPSDLKVSFTIPTNDLSTRSVVVGPVTNNPAAEIKSANVYVLRGTAVVAERKIKFTEGEKREGSAVFENILIGGGETVVISANGKHNTINNLEVSAIQPTADSEGLGNVYYRSSTALAAVTPTGDTKKIYALEGIVVSPVAARVELGGSLKIDPTFVDTATVDVVTPSAYTNVYGNKNLFYPQFGADANQGALAITGEDFYAQVSDPASKVIANHLFAGDEQRIVFRIVASTYDVLKTGTEAIKLNGTTSDSKAYSSYIYQDADGQLYALPLSKEEITTKNAEKTFNISTTDSGLQKVKKETVKDINGVDTDKYSLDGAIGDDVVLATSETIGKTNGFYSMVRFGEGESSLTQIDEGKYKSGVIYKLDFGKMDWNNDGKIDNNDAYNPNDNGEGTPSPSKPTDITVQATVADWTTKNVVPGIE